MAVGVLAVPVGNEHVPGGVLPLGIDPGLDPAGEARPYEQPPTRLIFPGIASDGTESVTAAAVGTTVAIPEPTQLPSIPRQFNGGVEQWRPLVASIFPAWAVDTVLSVMWCESRGDPNATGAAGERGLMQIHPRWHYDATYDPEGNLRAAYRISSGGTDWSAWTCRSR